ncbi:MAG: hypothetical protein ACKPBU_06965, partial [Alphaproteobacteria bacterium]
MTRTRFVAAAALAASLGRGSLARAQASPTTITPDRSEILVNKDLAGERWAISRDVANGAVTGNVFVPGSDQA